jgi:hypothetical protein
MMRMLRLQQPPKRKKSSLRQLKPNLKPLRFKSKPSLKLKNPKRLLLNKNPLLSSQKLLNNRLLLPLL